MRRGSGESPRPAGGAALPEILAARLGGVAVVVGIGNPIRGDDAVGSLVARLLLERKGKGGIPSLRVIDAEEVPEAFLGPMTRPRPDAVVLVDAAELGEAPGTVALLEVEGMVGREASTHNAPLSLLAGFIRAETGADVFVLGIQPGGRDLAASPGPEVCEAATALASLLATVWEGRGSRTSTPRGFDGPRCTEGGAGHGGGGGLVGAFQATGPESPE